MTNPPVNWGYARTADGFGWLVGRGQYEGITPTLDPGRIALILWDTLPILFRSFSWLFWVPAALGLVIGFRIGRLGRLWLLGSVALFFCLTVVVLAGLNPPRNPVVETLLPYLAGAQVVFAWWCGLGLVWAGTLLARPRLQNAPVLS